MPPPPISEFFTDEELENIKNEPAKVGPTIALDGWMDRTYNCIQHNQHSSTKIDKMSLHGWIRITIHWLSKIILQNIVFVKVFCIPS
ncbi:MAG: hypothetical protein ACK55I_50360, partial [bacterium]